MLVMDCTLRDGANVVGKGFDARLTKMMIEGMIAAGITTIEMGNCLGLGAYEGNRTIGLICPRLKSVCFWAIRTPPSPMWIWLPDMG